MKIYDTWREGAKKMEPVPAQEPSSRLLMNDILGLLFKGSLRLALKKIPKDVTLSIQVGYLCLNSSWF